MSYVLVTLLVAVGTLIVHLLVSTYTYWWKRGVPHETPLPLFGNMKGIGKTLHFRDINERLYRRFKNSTPFAGMYLFFSKTVVVMDLDLIKNILIKDFGNFHDRNIFHNERDDPLTGHLLTLEGDKWRAMRQKLTPVFTSGKMKFMFPTLVAVSENLVEACEKVGQASIENGVIKVNELCARFTTDVIGTCAFGIECNSLQDPNAEFRRHGRNIFEKPRHSQIVQSFMITNPKIARMLRMKLIPDHLTKFFMNAVSNTVEYRKKNGVKRNDFMDLLIEIMAEDQEAARQGDGIDLSNGLTLEQMTAQTFVFFLAGFETSSTTMSFCLYELSLNTEIQERVREEISHVLKAHNGKVTYEAVSKMRYLDQVIAETLRKYTVLPNLLRKTVSDYPVPNCEHIIPAGCTVLIPIDAIHHDPELYPNPEKFDPTRFDEDSVRDRHACAYLPFGDGPRNCIGMRFGKMQAKVGILTLLKAYKFTATTRTEIPIILSKRNILITTQNGIYLHAERI